MPIAKCEKCGDIEIDGINLKFKDAPPALDEMPNNSVDCVIADPDDTTIAVEVLKKVGGILKNNSHAYMFTQWDTYPIFSTKHSEGA